MELERYLKFLMSPNINVNIDQGELQNHNTDEGVLDTGDDYFNEGALEVLESNLPQTIAFLVTLEPKGILDEYSNFSFKFSSKGIDFKTVTLGNTSDERVFNAVASSCKSITFKWSEADSLRADDNFDAVAEFIPDLIYKKEFEVVSGNSLHLSDEVQLDHTRISKCSHWSGSRKDEAPVIPVGGYLHKGLDLEKCTQMFVTTDSVATGGVTKLNIKSQSYWDDLGLGRNNRVKVQRTNYSYLQSPNSTRVDSIAHDIRSGLIHIPCGEDGVQYVSTNYVVASASKKQIIIYFKLI